MKVITAPEIYTPTTTKDITLFLGGGICNCYEWQKVVIEELNKVFKDNDNIVVYNPRRDQFDMNDPNAGRKQIEWEFNNLNNNTLLFTMFFANSVSD